MREEVLEPKVNADSGDVALLELVIGKSTEDGRLADRRRPNYHKF